MSIESRQREVARYKKEIADLKSGDPDTASVTASTDPPAEGSPTPEGD